MTTVTSGPSYSALSRSAALSRSLVNRLRRRLLTAGKTRLQITWKKPGPHTIRHAIAMNLRPGTVHR